MKKFEAGKTYVTRSICDSDCKFEIKIIKRTEKTLVFERDGKQRRTKIFVDADGEYIAPERYSMAPVWRAARDLVEGEDTGSAATEEATTIIMLGQQVEGNFGACYPAEYGIIVGFVEAPATRWKAEHVEALVKWADRGRLERVDLSDIHPKGWRSANGSPIGIFVA